jgi:hypothetical protein
MAASPESTASGENALPRNADLYLVPIGPLPDDLLPRLAEYYTRVFDLNVAVAAQFPLLPTALDSARKQLIAEEVTNQLGRGFDAWVVNPGALLVGVTVYDLFVRSMRWRFVYSHRAGNRYAVLSGARMDQIGGPWTPLRIAGLRKMLTKTVALQLYGLPLSADPRSVLYGRVLGLQDLARIDEATVQRDVLSHPRRARWHASRATAPRSPPEPEGSPPSRLSRFGPLAAIFVFLAFAIWTGILYQRRTERAWRDLAAQRGWKFRERSGPWYNRGAYGIEFTVDGALLHVDWIETGTYRSRMRWTRIRAAVPTAQDFRIYEESVFSRVQKRFGLEDATLGDPVYDAAFVIRTNDRTWLAERLPVHLRRRHLRDRVQIVVRNGQLETRGLGIAVTEQKLLSQIQLASDLACALRGRPRLAIALDAAQDETPAPGADSLAPGTGRARKWLRRGAISFAAAYFLGAFYFLFWIVNEHGNEPWRIASLWVGPILVLCYLAILARKGEQLRRNFATNALPLLVGLPIVLMLVLLFAGPWVSAWNALSDAREAWLLGPVMEKREVRGRRTEFLVTVHDSLTDRDVKRDVGRERYGLIRLGDPIALKLRLGALGIWHGFRWQRDATRDNRASSALNGRSVRLGGHITKTTRADFSTGSSRTARGPTTPTTRRTALCG